MATNGNPKYIVKAYYPSGQMSGFEYHDTAESMIQDYRGTLVLKKLHGGRVEVFRCSDSQEILDPEAEVVS